MLLPFLLGSGSPQKQRIRRHSKSEVMEDNWRGGEQLFRAIHSGGNNFRGVQLKCDIAMYLQLKCGLINLTCSNLPFSVPRNRKCDPLTWFSVYKMDLKGTCCSRERSENGTSRAVSTSSICPMLHMLTC